MSSIGGTPTDDVRPPDGPVDATPAVIGVATSDTARYVTLGTYGDEPGADLFLLIERADAAAAVGLTEQSVRRVTELQNGVAYLGPQVRSVRVRTPRSRKPDLLCALAALGALASPLAYGGVRFRLSVSAPPRRRPGRR